MVNWKDILIPIIVAIIAFLGTSLTFIVSALLRPDISIDVIVNKENPRNVLVNLTNKGYAPATQLKFTMEFPHAINTVRIFSTENYNKTINSSILFINIPRIVPGQGSLVRINASTIPGSPVAADDKYRVYTTYDQGSSAAVATVYAQPVSSLDLIAQLLNNSLFNYTVLIVTIISSIIPFIIMRRVKH